MQSVSLLLNNYFECSIKFLQFQFCNKIKAKTILELAYFIFNSEITRLFQMITDEELSTGWEGPIWISKEDRSRLPRFEYIGNNQSGVADLCDTLLNTRPGCACSECTEKCECGSSYVQNENEVAVLRPGIPSVTG